MPYPFAREIAEAAARHNMDPHVLGALVLVESSGKPNAYRYEPNFWHTYLEHNPRWKAHPLGPERIAASYGLTQILYVTAVEHGFTYAEPEYLYVPSINLFAGATHLADLVAWADNDLEKALAAYNGGKGATLKQPYRTAAYAAKVLEQYRVLEARPP